MVGVPLNIMCSKRWAMPVIPGRSLELPTCATQPPATVGSSCRWTRRSLIPFGSVFSITGTLWSLALEGVPKSAAKLSSKKKVQIPGRRANKRLLTGLQLAEIRPASTAQLQFAGIRVVSDYVRSKFFGDTCMIKRIHSLTVLLSIVGLCPCARAQFGSPGGQAGLNAAMTKLFGETKSFTSQAEVKMLDKGGTETMTMPMTFSMLEGKIRADIDMARV